MAKHVESRYFGKRSATRVAVWGASSLCENYPSVKFLVCNVVNVEGSHLGFIIPVFPEAITPINGRRARLKSFVSLQEKA
jgi:hypothetical protein